MNANINFVTRDCPCCGSSGASAEVSSAKRAEAFSAEDLRPYWRGLFKEKVFFTYARCSECGTLYAPHFFNEEQLQELYSAMEPNMDMVSSDAIEATQRSYFNEVIDGLDANGSFLEIGPDVGYLVRLAAEKPGFDHFYLFEPNLSVHPDLVAAVHGRPHTISADMTDLSRVPDGSVSLAFMVHVLDHLLDPREMLEQVRRKLKPDGRLAIVTHNERSLLRSVMGTRWPPFCLQHPELYNPASITGLLKSTDFSRVDVRRSKNYFPIRFMARQAAYTFGLKIDRLPLPNATLGLRLGNMITIAQP